MNEKQNNHSSNGFLLGMLVGGALFFLVGTKKGRRLLKELTEKGIEVLDDVTSLEDYGLVPEGYEQEDDLDDEVFENEKDSLNKEKVMSSKNGNSFGKRFFKGVKKK